MRMEGTNILASRKLKPALVRAQVYDHDMRDLANVFVPSMRIARKYAN